MPSQRLLDFSGALDGVNGEHLGRQRMVDSDLIGEVTEGHYLSGPGKGALTNALRVSNVGEKDTIERMVGRFLVKLLRDPIRGDNDASSLRAPKSIRK